MECVSSCTDLIIPFLGVDGYSYVNYCYKDTDDDYENGLILGQRFDDLYGVMIIKCKSNFFQVQKDMSTISNVNPDASDKNLWVEDPMFKSPRVTCEPIEEGTQVNG